MTPLKDTRLAALAVALIVLGTLAAAAGVVAQVPGLAFAGRWAALVGLVFYAVRRRSLTAWILIAMLIGAEIGHDWPAVGQSARLLSQIFLRLIKTIIAPLLFATLVVGIAGHSNLRQVGRMGIKALVYFEVVTTLALFIGWAAISLSRAGVGSPCRRRRPTRSSRSRHTRGRTPSCTSFPRTS